MSDHHHDAESSPPTNVIPLFPRVGKLGIESDAGNPLTERPNLLPERRPDDKYPDENDRSRIAGRNTATRCQ